jgi:capsular polysaccharide export protein
MLKIEAWIHPTHWGMADERNKAMRRPRRNHGAILKAQVALAAVKGNKTVADLSKQYRVYPSQVAKGKHQLLARAADVFDGTEPSSEALEERSLVKRGLQSFAGKHVLLLQGPLGPFFKRLSRDLEGVGARVSKINFHGGDWVFYPTGSIRYAGRMEEWLEYLEAFLVEQNIDIVFMYGDCRPVHKGVREVAERAGVEVGVFEAGYIRPHYITLERLGINDYSTLPRDAEFYRAFSGVQTVPPRSIGNVFWHAALWSVVYYVVSTVLRPWYPHYQHHRSLSVREGALWLRGLWRKYYYHVKERTVRQGLFTKWSGRFFMVPLQVYYDSQMRTHSHYASVESFIREVVADFAKHADSDACLILKHHPMDRAYCDYTELCTQLEQIHGIKGRLFYLHELHLPTVFKHCRGVVAVNSTVGLSAVLEGLPVKVCGRAIYDIPGLTYGGELSDFWKAASRFCPDPEVRRGFNAYVITHTQMNGNAYRRLKLSAAHTGLPWSGESVKRVGEDTSLAVRGEHAFRSGNRSDDKLSYDRWPIEGLSAVRSGNTV